MILKDDSYPLVQLIRFNRRAVSLIGSRFVEWMRENPKSFNHEDFRQMNWLGVCGINREELDAFCLNLRFMVQDKDGFSLRCIQQIYENLPDEFTNFKALASSEHSHLKSFLSESSFMKIGPDVKTNHELFQTFFYGGLVHENPQHIEDFLYLTSTGAFSIFAIISFLRVLNRYVETIREFSVLNEGLMIALSESNMTHTD